MKVAVLLSGLLRTFDKESVTSSLFNFLNNNFDSYDIYSSIWDNHTELQINKAKQIYSPQILETENFENWDKSIEAKFIEFCTQYKVPEFAYSYIRRGIFAQWYKIYKTFQLIPNPNEYDIILRSRYDISFNPIKLNLIKPETLYIEAPYLGNYGYRDYIFFSEPSKMQTICNLYNNLFSLNLESNTLHPAARFHHILAEHVFKQNVHIEYPITFIESLNSKHVR